MNKKNKKNNKTKNKNKLKTIVETFYPFFFPPSVLLHPSWLSFILQIYYITYSEQECMF